MAVAPNIDLFLIRPVISVPPLCTLKELDDGTYSIDDLYDMHEGLDLQFKVKEIGSRNT